MPSVLSDPEPLTLRAQEFLSKRADVVKVGRGGDDAWCRARLAKVFGECDDTVLVSLRGVQQRYSGLSYDSPYMGERVYFAPVLDPDEGDEHVEFLYTVCPTTASCVGASLLPDGTVIIGWERREVRAFPSLDRLIECDALLDAVRGAPLVDSLSGSDIESVLAELRGQRPALRLMEEASGYTTHWWTDGTVLVHLCRTWATLWEGTQPSVRVWAAPAALAGTGVTPSARLSGGRFSTPGGSAGEW